MSSIDEMLEHNRLLISTARATSNWAPTYEELRSNQASLIELVFTLVKDRATDVGSRHYIKLLEDSLKSAEQELRQERLEHDGSKVKIEQLEMRLRSTGAKVKHMSLAAKFHSVGIDKSVVGGYPGGHNLSLPDPPTHDVVASDPDDSLLGNKRSFDDLVSSDTDSFTFEAVRDKGIYVTCIGCFLNERSCDGAEPCGQCVEHGRKTCQRARCQDYRIGACKRQSCTWAHESDGCRYKNIVDAGHVAKKKKAIVGDAGEKGSPPKRARRGAMPLLTRSF